MLARGIVSLVEARTFDQVVVVFIHPEIRVGFDYSSFVNRIPSITAISLASVIKIDVFGRAVTPCK